MKKNKHIVTYDDFSIEHFKEEKRLMEDFRRNCYGDAMEDIWKSIAEEYMPDASDASVFGTYTLDTDGNATPDKLFMASDDDERMDLKESLVAVKVHTGLSILTQRTPNVKWDSQNESYESRVPVLNAMRESDWDDPEVRAQYVMLWFYNIFFGTTFWRRFYLNEEREVFLPTSIDFSSETIEYEKEKMVDFSGITAEALHPLDVWIDPATRPMKPRSMRKVKYDKVMSYADFYRVFKDLVPKKKLDEILPTSIDDFHGDKNVRCEYFEDKDLDLFYIVANDKELMKEHLPYNHKQLSIEMSIWMPRKDRRNPYGLGPIEMMIPDKKVLDEFKSMTLTQVKFSIYKAIFYSGMLESEGEGGDIKIRPDRAYKVADPKNIQFYDMPGPGGESWKAMEYLRGRIDDTSGINRPLGGEIVKTTAFQTDLAKDAALARLTVPISNIVLLLQRDAELHFALQKQFYALPDVEEIVDPDKIEAMMAELEKMKATGKQPSFDIWVDSNDDGDVSVYKAEYMKQQLNIESTPQGSKMPSLAKQEVVLTPAIFDWKGKIRVVADSLLTITPTVDKSRKMELYNLLIPLFMKPPEMVAKPARELCKLYNEDYQDILPDHFMQYLQASDSGAPPPPSPDVQNPAGRPREFGAAAKKAGFNQERADKVVTNVNGQKDQVSAQSEQISP